MRQLNRSYSDMRRSSRGGLKWHSDIEVDPNEEFSCFHLCGDCHFLCDHTRACPACGSETVLDLKQKTVGNMVREMEDERRNKVSPKAMWIATALAVTNFFVVWLIAGEIISWFWPPIAIFTLGLLLGIVALATTRVFLPRWLSWLFERSKQKGPSRWRQALPRPTVDTAIAAQDEGPCQSAGELIQAPLSGRKCLAYRIGVLFDRAGDAVPPEWVLDEQATADISVGVHRLKASGYTLLRPLTPVAADDLAMDETAMSRFLRERGLFLSDGEFVFFESIVAPQEHCRVYIPEHETGCGPIVEPIATGNA